MQLMYGGDIVAPPGNQVANSEHKHLPVASGVPSLLDKNSAVLFVSRVERWRGGLGAAYLFPALSSGRPWE